MYLTHSKNKFNRDADWYTRSLLRSLYIYNNRKSVYSIKFLYHFQGMFCQTFVFPFSTFKYIISILTVALLFFLKFFFSNFLMLCLNWNHNSCFL